MKTENSNTDKNKKRGHSHSKHMKMMAICCGLPVVGFLAIGILGISMPSLETFLLVIGPIGMVGMIYMMIRDNQGDKNSCYQSEKSEDDSVADITYNGTENKKPGSAKPQQPGLLEA